jgi:hypothetical protein
MGRIIQIFFDDPVDWNDFTQLVSGMNGYVADDGRDVGFSEGGGHVWSYGARSGLAGDFERFESDEVALLGRAPSAGLVLGLSHHRESGPLALRIASALLKHWHGHAFLAIGMVIGKEDLEKIATAGVAGHCFNVFVAHEPRLNTVLGLFDALVVDAALAPSATASLLRFSHSDFDPEQETIVAMIAADKDDVWVTRSRRLEMPSGSAFAEYVRQRIETDLQQFGGELHIVLRRAEFSMEADRVSLRFALALLKEQGGLVAGTFHRVVDADELRRLLDLGHGVFIS